MYLHMLCELYVM